MAKDLEQLIAGLGRHWDEPNEPRGNSPLVYQVFSEAVAELNQEFKELVGLDTFRKFLEMDDLDGSIDRVMRDWYFLQGLMIGAALQAGERPDYPKISEIAARAVDDAEMTGYYPHYRSECGPECEPCEEQRKPGYFFEILPDRESRLEIARGRREEVQALGLRGLLKWLSREDAEYLMRWHELEMED